MHDVLRAAPRVQLATWPTPLTYAPRFSEAIKADVWIKRDDIGPLGLAGNKVRKLEFLLAKAIGEGADTVVTLGTRISNSARAAAAACAQLGLECVLILGGEEPETATGNLLLDALFGADLRYQPRVAATGPVRWDQLDEANRKVGAALEAEGRTPFVLPVGCSSPHAVLGFVAAYSELTTQLQRMGVSAGRIYHASTSGGTHAGLALGHRLAGSGPRPCGIGAADNVYPDMHQRYLELMQDTARLLGETCEPRMDWIDLDMRFLGEGYGVATREAIEAINLLARTEGILTDPVYTGKALAALVSAAGKGELSEPVVFWHTGGTPGVFEPEYARALCRHSRGRATESGRSARSTRSR